MMPAPVFLFHPDGDLISLNQQLFASEDDLQSIIAKHPELIVSVVDSVGNLLLIKREAGVPGGDDGVDAFSLDHLFLDSEGVPTLVEVKRSTDTRIRREVVGQMLDYAAHAGPYWSIDTLMSMFSQTCGEMKKDPEKVLQDFIGADGEIDQFWTRVKTNLQAGHMRLIFLADELPQRLQRVIEFLNTQCDPCEVLGIEVRQYLAENGMRMVAPRIIGQSVAVEQKKGTTLKRQWDRDSFLAELGKNRPEEEVKVVTRILDWVEKNRLRIWWGRGGMSGSFVPLLDFNDDSYQMAAFWTDGSCQIRFNEIKKHEPFASDERRIDFVKRFIKITGQDISLDRIAGKPQIPLSSLVKEKALTEFLQLYEWFFEEIKKGVVEE